MLSLQSLIICWKAMWMPSSWQNALGQVLGGLGNCRRDLLGELAGGLYTMPMKECIAMLNVLNASSSLFCNHVFCFDWS